MLCLLSALFAGCGGSTKYKIENGKVFFISYGGPLPMFGINYQRHKVEILDADAETFVDFKYKLLAKDKNNVYYRGKIFGEKMNVDALTFEITGDYGKDKNNVYSLSNPHIANSVVDSVDIKTFVGIGFGYGKDKNYLFKDYRICKFQPIDIASFEMLEERSWGRDKDYYYFCEKIVDVHRPTFELLQNYYAKDKNSVYYYYLSTELKVVEGADSKTFKVLTRKKLDKGVAEDRNNYYIGMEKATKKEIDKVP